MNLGLGGLSLVRGRGIPSWTPANLFLAGASGAWHDPSDLSTIWQDDAGTVAGAVDQPVGKLEDKSGNARHLTQATAAKRPMLRLSGSTYYLEFDAVDDMLSASFAFTQPYTRIGLIQQRTHTGKYLMDGAVSNSAALFQDSPSPEIGLFAGAAVSPVTADLALTTWGVVTEIYDGASSKIAVDNNAYATGSPGTTGAGGITLGSQGGAGANFSDLLLGDLVFIAGVMSDADIAATRTYMGNKAGLSL